MNSFLSSYHEICIPNPNLSSGFSLFINSEERQCFFVSRTDRVSYYYIEGNDEILGKEIVLKYQDKEEHVDGKEKSP